MNSAIFCPELPKSDRDDEDEKLFSFFKPGVGQEQEVPISKSIPTIPWTQVIRI
jgi:hypothetical protein